MKPGLTFLTFFERTVRSHGFGILLIGGLMLIFYLGGRGGLYEAYHLAAARLPTERIVSA